MDLVSEIVNKIEIGDCRDTMRKLAENMVKVWR